MIVGDGNRQPARPAGREDAVPIPPGAVVLHVVEQDELVGHVDQIEVALPRDVARLDDGDLRVLLLGRFRRPPGAAFAEAHESGYPRSERRPPAIEVKVWRSAVLMSLRPPPIR